MILQCIDDLETLRAFVVALPSFRAIFEKHPLELEVPLILKIPITANSEQRRPYPAQHLESQQGWWWESPSFEYTEHTNLTMTLRTPLTQAMAPIWR